MSPSRPSPARILDELRQDGRYALRMLVRAPGFTVVAAGILAIGIGATTAIFSAVDAVVLRPLPYAQPERLVRVYATTPSTTPFDEATPGDFMAWRRENRAFERVAPVETRGMTLADGSQLPEQVTGVRTTADYFPMLGVPPLLGRTFLPEEDTPGRERVAVINHGLWQRRFGGERDVIGRSVRLDGLPFTIVGVMPPAFDGATADVDLWTPIAFTPEHESNFDIGYLDVIARLRPDVTLERAQADLSSVARRVGETVGNEDRDVRIVPYMDDFVGALRARLLVLLGAVGLVLLIACVNVANLLLARGSGRAKEMSVRAALGAGRGRVVRQLLAESLMLGLLGGAAGVVVAYATLRLLTAASPGGVPRLDQATLDVRALGFALVITVTAGALSGVLPALRTAGVPLYAALRRGGRSSSHTTRERLRQALVVAEVALSLVLLAAAGLLIRSAILTHRVDPGLDAENVWTGRITLPAVDYTTPESRVRAFERMIDGIRALPGVASAASISYPPFSGVRSLGGFVPEGRPIDADNMLLGNLRLATPGIFETMGVRMVSGRSFTEQDDVSTPPVIVVNEAFARSAWPGESAVGKRVYGPGGGEGGPVARDVIGVAADIREEGLREQARPTVYYPVRQVPESMWEAVQGSMFVVVRTESEPLALTSGVQNVLQQVDPGLAIASVQTMEQRIAGLLAAARFNTRMLAALGMVGLVLAVVGIYGVVAYFVSQRTGEFGVRMALGASTTDILALVVRQGLRPVLIGIGIGAAGALAATRALGSQLYGVRHADPATYAAVTAVLIGAAILACAIPARRAARVEPCRALDG